MTFVRNGLGLAPVPFYQHKGVGHSGKLGGFETLAAYFPADSLTAVVFSNGAGYSPCIERIYPYRGRANLSLHEVAGGRSAVAFE